MQIRSVMSGLEHIYKKLDEGKRLDRSDGLSMLQTDNVLGIGHLANEVRHAKVGDQVYFNNLCFAPFLPATWSNTMLTCSILRPVLE